MNSSLNKFNALAPYYDFMAKIIFGKSIVRAQTSFLNDVPIGGCVLILGGGSGKILPELHTINPTCRIWYIEASSSMLNLARENAKDFSFDEINFIHGTHNEVPTGVKFDTVITNFFLDLFSDNTLSTVLGKIHSILSPNGNLLVTDFADQGKFWQHILLKIMYRFFRITCGIEAEKLPLWQVQFNRIGFREIKSEYFFRSFIKSSVLTKSVNE